jgi:DNA-binding NarL/FixJ family response regulator
MQMHHERAGSEDPIWALVLRTLRRQRWSDGRPSTLSDSPISLTRRQLQVLHLLADGRSTDEIVHELGLSRTTVRNYIAGLLAALGAHNRLQAVVAARKAGLLDA